MSLESGTTVGTYQVTAKIGEGGMGEVYRARDTTLDRDVALKVLPEAFTADPDRLGRFEREAKVLASLNHPNIGGIHGLEQTGDTRALVLELVEGPTLAERIEQGPIPIEEALPIATQIAEALEAAHEQGVIHRDLKPANIKVRADATVKVLDFGLAKAFQTEASDPNMSLSPTISLTAAATQMGMVIGTAAYMSPEQAKGKPVGKQADVWAFGAVLYEMLTGRRPFAGTDVSDTLAMVLMKDVDWSALPAETPASARTLLTRCLARDPKQRIRDIGDAQLAMTGAFETTVPETSVSTEVPPPRPWQQPIPLALAAVALLVTGGLLSWAVTRPPAAAAPGLVRFTIDPPETEPLNVGSALSNLAISRDGTMVVYSSRQPDAPEGQLVVRSSDQLTAAPLRGGEGGVGPFLSPDGAWVGFVGGNDRVLSKVSVFGGPPVTLADVGRPILGASWGLDDQIFLGRNDAGLFRVSGGGGEPEAVTQVDVEQRERHAWPFIIPGRDAVLFVIATGPPLSTGQLAVLDLATDEVSPLGLAGMSPRYVSTGHLVYAAEDGSVRAAPFDVASLEVTGNPVPLVEDVAVRFTGAASFDISDTGRFVYVSGGVDSSARSLVWIDRDGRQQPLDLPADNYSNARLSPDGSQISVRIRNDVWVSDIDRNTLSRLTTHPATDFLGVWTPDGERVIFSSERDGGRGLYSRAPDGTGAEDHLVTIDEATGLLLWDRAIDGDQLVFSHGGPNGGDVAVLSLEGEPVWTPLFDADADEVFPSISPDGRWVAYRSNESGDDEVYVQRFPEGGLRQRISTAGGTKPMWSPSGDALYYVLGNALMVAPLTLEPTLTTTEVPTVLFEANEAIDLTNFGVMALSPDGERFLTILNQSESGEDAAPPQITVVLNWFEELKARVPVN